MLLCTIGLPEGQAETCLDHASERHGRSWRILTLGSLTISWLACPTESEERSLRLRPAPSLREGSKGARGFAQDDSCEKHVLLGGWDEDGFGGFAPAFHFDFAVGADGAGYHAGGVEWGGDVALMVEGDYAAFTLLIDQLFHDSVVGGLLERDVEVADAFADIGGDDIAHEEFADSSAGDSAAFVVRVSAGADDGRIAHAAGHFVGGAAGGGASCEVAVLVESDYADCAVFAHWIVRHRGGFLLVFICFFSCALVLLPEAFVVEVVGRDEIDALRFGEGFCAGADEHHVRRFFHYEAREVDGISDVLQGGNGACGESFTVHDGGVHFGDAVASVIGAATGIVQAGVFH